MRREVLTRVIPATAAATKHGAPVDSHAAVRVCERQRTTHTTASPSAASNTGLVVAAERRSRASQQAGALLLLPVHRVDVQVLLHVVALKSE